jgi:hypothetical protein
MLEPPRSSEAFEQFRERVLNDRELLNRLRAAKPEEFIGACVQIAAELGYPISPAEVEDALKTARHDWVERWCQ